MTTSADILKINWAQNFPIDRIVNILGIEMDKKGRFVCPYHQDPVPSMVIVKAKNKCKCFECGAEASPLDLIQVILGYTDSKKALNFLQKYNTPVLIKPNTPVELGTEFAAPPLPSDLPSAYKILTEFYSEFCSDVNQTTRNMLHSLKLNIDFVTADYMGMLVLSASDILQQMSRRWSFEDLVDSGLFVATPEGDLSLIFDQDTLIIPHPLLFDVPEDIATTGTQKIISFITGINPGLKGSFEKHTQGKYWQPFSIKVENAKKVLLCEGVFNVFSLATFSRLFNPYSLILEYLTPEILEKFRGTDVTVAFNHPMASEGKKQKDLTDQYNEKNKKIAALFKEHLNQNITILNTPIGIELGQFFKRYR